MTDFYKDKEDRTRKIEVSSLEQKITLPPKKEEEKYWVMGKNYKVRRENDKIIVLSRGNQEILRFDINAKFMGKPCTSGMIMGIAARPGTSEPQRNALRLIAYLIDNHKLILSDK